MTSPASGVFINCPFDTAYAPLFEAILFTIVACGYQARCALEEIDAADIRFDKLSRLIEQCRLSIHDLSRVELNDNDLPRFNMPFELGLVMGAKRFGTAKHKSKSALIMVREQYRLPAYLSDLGGNDPSSHAGETANVVRIVRRYLQSGPHDIPLPGAQHIHAQFLAFRAVLPDLAGHAKISVDEINPFDGYLDYMNFLSAFLKDNPVV